MLAYYSLRVPYHLGGEAKRLHFHHCVSPANFQNTQHAAFVNSGAPSGLERFAKPSFRALETDERAAEIPERSICCRNSGKQVEMVETGKDLSVRVGGLYRGEASLRAGPGASRAWFRGPDRAAAVGRGGDKIAADGPPRRDPGGAPHGRLRCSP